MDTKKKSISCLKQDSLSEHRGKVSQKPSCTLNLTLFHISDTFVQKSFCVFILALPCNTICPIKMGPEFPMYLFSSHCTEHSKCLINDAKCLTSYFSVLVIEDCVKRGINKVISNPHATKTPVGWICRKNSSSVFFQVGCSIPHFSSQRFSLFINYPLAYRDDQVAYSMHLLVLTTSLNSLYLAEDSLIFTGTVPGFFTYW